MKSYLIIFEAGPSVRTVGGAFLATINILQVLSKNSDVVFLCDERVVKSFSNLIPSDIKVIKLPKRKKQYYGFYRGMLYDAYIISKFVKYIATREVVVSTSVNESFSLFSFFASYRFYHSVAKRVSSNSIKMRSLFLSGCLSKASYFAVSNFHKENLISYGGIKANKIDVIYNKPYFSPTTKRLSTNKSGSDYIILSVGHVTSYKRPDIWLVISQKLTQKYKNITFNWVGGGELLSEYQKLTSTNPRVNFLGHQDSLDAHYKQSDIFLHTSQVETHGMAVVEAMSYGLPIVSSNAGGLNETVEHDRNGFLISIENIDLYMESLELIINNKLLFNNFSEQSIRVFEEKFSSEIYENNIVRYLIK
jgi:glycosyltransferase involved in cell wall biosynthesis